MLLGQARDGRSAFGGGARLLFIPAALWMKVGAGVAMVAIVVTITGPAQRQLGFSFLKIQDCGETNGKEEQQLKTSSAKSKQ